MDKSFLRITQAAGIAQMVVLFFIALGVYQSVKKEKGTGSHRYPEKKQIKIHSLQNYKKMPVVKASDPLPESPVVIVLFGDPGVGKTSLFNTSFQPLLLDFDRGGKRAIHRQDMVVINRWEDVLEEETKGTFKDYSTIGIDTAKAALDDFLMAYVIQKDYKLAKNKLQAYGALGDEFKVFVATRRNELADLVIIAHSKDEKEGDITKKLPDVTGQSYALLMRIADQVGYVTIRNNRRVIQFDPTDTIVGKNVAKLPVMEIPDGNDPKFKTFLAHIITTTKRAMISNSEAQNEALEKSERYQHEISTVSGPAELSLIVSPVQELPKALKDSLLKLIGDKAREKGWTWNKEERAFVAPIPVTEQAGQEELHFK